MSVNYASSQKVGLLVGEENVPGTEAANIDKVLGAIQSANIPPAIDEIPLRTHGGGRGVYYSVDGAEHVGFDIDMILQTGLFLYYFMGKTIDTGGPVYQHALSFLEPIPSLSIEKISTDLSRSHKVIGGKINECTIASNKGEEVRVTLSGMGLKYDHESTQGVPAKLELEPMVFHQCDMKINNVDYEDVLQSFSLTMRQNLSELLGHAQANPQHLPEGPLDAELTVEVASQNDNFITLFTARTEFSTILKFIRTASDDEISITIPHCKVYEFDEPLNIEDEFIRITVPIKIFRANEITSIIKDAIDVYETAS